MDETLGFDDTVSDINESWNIPTHAISEEERRLKKEKRALRKLQRLMQEPVKNKQPRNQHIKGKCRQSKRINQPPPRQVAGGHW